MIRCLIKIISKFLAAHISPNATLHFCCHFMEIWLVVNELSFLLFSAWFLLLLNLLNLCRSYLIRLFAFTNFCFLDLCWFFSQMFFNFSTIFFSHLFWLCFELLSIKITIFLGNWRFLFWYLFLFFRLFTLYFSIRYHFLRFEKRQAFFLIYMKRWFWFLFWFWFRFWFGLRFWFRSLVTQLQLFWWTLWFFSGPNK